MFSVFPFIHTESFYEHSCQYHFVFLCPRLCAAPFDAPRPSGAQPLAVAQHVACCVLDATECDDICTGAVTHSACSPFEQALAAWATMSSYACQHAIRRVCPIACMAGVFALGIGKRSLLMGGGMRARPIR